MSGRDEFLATLLNLLAEQEKKTAREAAGKGLGATLEPVRKQLCGSTALAAETVPVPCVFPLPSRLRHHALPAAPQEPEPAADAAEQQQAGADGRLRRTVILFENERKPLVRARENTALQPKR